MKPSKEKNSRKMLETTSKMPKTAQSPNLKFSEGLFKNDVSLIPRK